MFPNLNCFIGITNSDTLIIFKVENSRWISETVYSIIEKLECSQTSKFLRFKMILGSDYIFCTNFPYNPLK